MQQWHQRWATEALRVAKPGAYLLAFGGTRTVHRLTVALEDAGWVIRDLLVWAYASGFPKSKSSLKPAWEPIVLARKPGPLAPLAIDACRLPTEGRPVMVRTDTTVAANAMAGKFTGATSNGETTTQGRWPANVVLTGPIFDGDSGTYSRFFLIPKASRSDREPLVPGDLEEGSLETMGAGAGEWTKHGPDAIRRRNTHPTVKPTDLMRHLVRLVTPQDGTVLDPFLGSGTTAIAAEAEGFEWVGIEREAEYVKIAEQRLVATQRGMGL
jgi:site-specific DNA-methyltransferase (adenine-specific)